MAPVSRAAWRVVEVGARPGSSTGPSGQKIPSNRQFADLGVKLTYLAFMISPTAAHTVREHLAKPFDRLVLQGNLLQRPVAPKRFQCQTSLLNHQKTCGPSSSHIPLRRWSYTLNNCPISGAPLHIRTDYR